MGKIYIIEKLLSYESELYYCITVLSSLLGILQNGGRRQYFLQFNSKNSLFIYFPDTSELDENYSLF